MAKKIALFDGTGLSHVDARGGPQADEGDISTLGTAEFDAKVGRADGAQDEEQTFAARGGMKAAAQEESIPPSSTWKDRSNPTVFKDDDSRSSPASARFSPSPFFSDFEERGWTTTTTTSPPVTDREAPGAFEDAGAFGGGGASAAVPSTATGAFGDDAFGEDRRAFGGDETDAIADDDDVESYGRDARGRSFARSVERRRFGGGSRRFAFAEAASASSSGASDGTAVAPAAADARFESFRSGLSEEQLAVFEEIVAEHEAKVRKLEGTIRAEDAGVEFAKGEATSRTLSLLGIAEEGRGDGSRNDDPRADEVASAERLVDVAAMNREIADLRVRLEASEAAVVQLEWEKGRKGNKKLKKGAKKLNEVLRGKKGGGGGGMMTTFSPSRRRRHASIN
mmetsp:Transcript_6375/g.13950  ORF Transcript_6375/g.13950 Transcript_6375/m.13950 type:complete len:396 (+) Transcript_6375:1564-2751(+)